MYVARRSVLQLACFEGVSMRTFIVSVAVSMSLLFLAACDGGGGSGGESSSNEPPPIIVSTNADLSELSLSAAPLEQTLPGESTKLYGIGKFSCTFHHCYANRGRYRCQNYGQWRGGCFW